LKQLNGQINVMYTGSFFHLFSYDKQMDVAIRVVEILAPVPGSILIGRQVGNDNPGAFTIGTPGGQSQPYRHNAESWKAFWDEVGQKTGSKWKVHVEMDKHWDGFTGSECQLALARMETGTRRMAFVVRRV
jgi:hypothetical protein